MSLDKNTDFVTGLIELYRSYACLWCIKDKSYLDKRKRNVALNEKMEFCRPYCATVDKE